MASCGDMYRGGDSIRIPVLLGRKKFSQRMKRRGRLSIISIINGFQHGGGGGGGVDAVSFFFIIIFSHDNNNVHAHKLQDSKLLLLCSGFI